MSPQRNLIGRHVSLICCHPPRLALRRSADNDRLVIPCGRDLPADSLRSSGVDFSDGPAGLMKIGLAEVDVRLNPFN